MNGAEVGKFPAVSAVVPSAVKVSESSIQGVIGKEVTLKAEVTVAAGQSKAGIPVTFNVVNSNSNVNSKIEVEAVTDENGVATYSYTRYYGSEDNVTAYATSKSSVYAKGKVYWANAAQLTVKDITTETTLVNGAKKVYQIESSKNAGKYVFVTFEENLDKTPDKITKGVKIEGVTTYTIDSDNSLTTKAVSGGQYPYEATTGGKAVTAVKLDSNGKANLVLSGSSASATPVVFEGELKAGGTGTEVTHFSDVTYEPTALQAKASKVTFELKHFLGLTIEAKGVQDAALNNGDGIGGRDYVVTYTNKDGKAADAGTKVLVAIPKAGLSSVSNLAVYDADEALLTSVYSDTKYVYYNVTVGKEGKATFTVTSSKENDYITPVAFLNNGTSSAIGLDDSDLQASGAITYFVSKVNYAAELVLNDVNKKPVTSFVAGKESAYFKYVLVDQNGKERKADADTEVSFEVYAGTGALTVNGGVSVSQGSYKTVTAKISKGSSTAQIKVDAVSPSEATVTATGSKAGIVLSSTEPTSVTAKFTQFATNAVTGVSANIDTTANTVTLVDTKNNVYVYSYDGATLLQNNSSVYENTFETLVGAGARVTVSKDDAGKLTFNIIATDLGLKGLTAQQDVDYLIKKAVIDNKDSVTLPLNTAESIEINTTADLDINVEIEKVTKLDIVAPNAEKINLVAKTSGNINGALTVNAPKATVTVGAGVKVTGTTNIVDVDTNTFINEGTLVGAVTISDSNGTRFVNNGTVGSVTVTGSGLVTLEGTKAYAVTVSGAAQVVVPKNSSVSALTVTSADATVTNNNGAGTTVDNKTEVLPVTGLKFEDTDKTTGTIKGKITFTSSKSTVEKYEVVIKDGVVATLDSKATELVFTADQNAALASTITVYSVDKDGKKSSPVSVNVVDDKSATEAAEKASDVVLLGTLSEELLKAYDEAKLPIRHKTAAGLGLKAEVDQDTNTIKLTGSTTAALLEATNSGKPGDDGYVLYGINTPEGVTNVTQVRTGVSTYKLADFSDGEATLKNGFLLNTLIYDADTKTFVKKTQTIEWLDESGNVVANTTYTIDASEVTLTEAK